jgi:predicted permease
VSEGFFKALGIPVLRGRDFEAWDEPAITPRDNLFANDSPANASRVCMVNESLARRLFGGANAMGRHLSFDDPYSAKMAIEIVGVVKDVHFSGVREADQTGIIYVPSWSNGAEERALVMRVPGKAAPAITAIQRELRDMDPNVPLLASARMEDTVSARLKNERMTAYSCGCFGALALALAAVGLYGVMAYAVARRTKEVGIRMALGAGRLGILGMMVGEALVPVLAGIAVGIAGGLAATGVVASLLFGVAPADPLSFVFAVVAMLGVALLAAAIPARRASRVEPVVALRHE